MLFASIIESANYASLDENDTEPNSQNQNNPPTSGILGGPCVLVYNIAKTAKVKHGWSCPMHVI